MDREGGRKTKDREGKEEREIQREQDARASG
jgi:hypothetical protein